MRKPRIRIQEAVTICLVAILGFFNSSAYAQQGEPLVPAVCQTAGGPSSNEALLKYLFWDNSRMLVVYCTKCREEYDAGNTNVSTLHLPWEDNTYSSWPQGSGETQIADGRCLQLTEASIPTTPDCSSIEDTNCISFPNAEMVVVTCTGPRDPNSRNPDRTPVWANTIQYWDPSCISYVQANSNFLFILLVSICGGGGFLVIVIIIVVWRVRRKTKKSALAEADKNIAVQVIEAPAQNLLNIGGGRRGRDSPGVGRPSFALGEGEGIIPRDASVASLWDLESAAGNPYTYEFDFDDDAGAASAADAIADKLRAGTIKLGNLAENLVQQTTAYLLQGQVTNTTLGYGSQPGYQPLSVASGSQSGAGSMGLGRMRESLITISEGSDIEEGGKGFLSTIPESDQVSDVSSMPTSLAMADEEEDIEAWRQKELAKLADRPVKRHGVSTGGRVAALRIDESPGRQPASGGSAGSATLVKAKSNIAGDVGGNYKGDDMDDAELEMWRLAEIDRQLQKKVRRKTDKGRRASVLRGEDDAAAYRRASMTPEQQFAMLDSLESGSDSQTLETKKKATKKKKKKKRSDSVEESSIAESASSLEEGKRRGSLSSITEEDSLVSSTGAASKKVKVKRKGADKEKRLSILRREDTDDLDTHRKDVFFEQQRELEAQGHSINKARRGSVKEARLGALRGEDGDNAAKKMFRNEQAAAAAAGKDTRAAATKSGKKGRRAGDIV